MELGSWKATSFNVAVFFLMLGCIYRPRTAFLFSHGCPETSHSSSVLALHLFVTIIIIRTPLVGVPSQLGLLAPWVKGRHCFALDFGGQMEDLKQSAQQSARYRSDVRPDVQNLPECVCHLVSCGTPPKAQEISTALARLLGKAPILFEACSSTRQSPYTLFEAPMTICFKASVLQTC